MPTHIGTLESEVELVDDAAPGAERVGSELVDETSRRRLLAKRERMRRRRTHAEGFSD